MKIQLASDLHTEFFRRGAHHVERLIPLAREAEVLVLAGDIAVALDIVDLFGYWPIPVVYVAGNHEFYGHDIAEIRAGLRSACAGTSVHFLDNDTLVLNGVRFLGSTLWTDYRLGEPGCSQQQAMKIAEQALNDHQLIQRHGGLFTSSDALTEHLSARAWLQDELSEAKHRVEKTVVVTHHGPHASSVHARYQDDPLSAAFVSDLSDLLPLANLWLHGHVHDSFDYVAHGCRVVTNPRGYPLLASRRARSELPFENRVFEPTLLVEV